MNYDWSQRIENLTWNHRCTHCGKKEISNNGRTYLPPSEHFCVLEFRLIVEEKLCWTCAFFRAKQIKKFHIPMDNVEYPDRTVVQPVVDGHLYWVSDCRQMNYGARPQYMQDGTYIEMHDGRVYKAGKVGHNGIIPVLWESVFPDDAEFHWSEVVDWRPRDTDGIYRLH